MNPKNVLIVSGEPSGDLHASNLVKDLKSINPRLSFFGLGGTLSKEAGVDVDFDISKLALVGYIEVLKNIFTVGRVYRGLLKKIDSKRPDLAILVDYPGFNLRLAQELKKRSIPVVYYISPQVWAWGRNRIHIIKRYVDKMVVFFKFEEGLYRENGVNAEFVGNPLLDIARPALSKEEIVKKYAFYGNKKIVALLPGSRSNEVKILLPIMLSACKIIAERMDGVEFVIAKFKGLNGSLYEEIVNRSAFPARIVEDDVHNLLSVSHFAIVASGTATLETAIIGTPFVIIYKVNPLTAFIADILRKGRFLGLPNIIAGKEVVPELIQSKAIPRNIAGAAIDIMTDNARVDAARREFSGIRSSLGSPGAGRRAAESIAKFMGQI